MTRHHVSVGVIGPLIGRNPGEVTTQAEKLTDLFASAGYPVIAASSAKNRYVRLADIAQTIARKAREVDLFVISVFSGPSFVVADIASGLAKAMRKPIILSLNGGALGQQFDKYPSWSRRVLSRGEAIVSQSGFLKEQSEKLGFAARVIPNVFDVPNYPHRVRQSVRPRLFWMRAFHSIYHPELAVRVLARLREKFDDAELIMGGSDKGLLDRTRGLARELGVDGYVEFPGFLDSEQKLKAGERSDIFLNTNRIDNRPIAVVEACAMGLCVVATNVGGLPYLLEHEKTGLLVPEGDVDAMTEAVVRLVEEPSLAARLSANGRPLAELSSPDRVLGAWEEVFTQVAGG